MASIKTSRPRIIGLNHISNEDRFFEMVQESINEIESLKQCLLAETTIVYGNCGVQLLNGTELLTLIHNTLFSIEIDLVCMIKFSIILKKYIDFNSVLNTLACICGILDGKYPNKDSIYTVDIHNSISIFMYEIRVVLLP